MCYGYCYSELEVKQGKASLLVGSRDEDKNCPNRVVKANLSDKRWKEMTQAIDREALFALPNSIGCPGCVDEVVESIEVRFSDHTKKTVQYNLGGAPKKIKALAESLLNLHEKMRKELPLRPVVVTNEVPRRRSGISPSPFSRDSPVRRSRGTVAAPGRTRSAHSC